jgi:proline iminopeptidase
VLDQRGSGRSRPLANEPDASLSTNTTAHLIADIEALREVLGLDRWTILGLSWGTTLGLAYAQALPHRVNALLLGFVATTSRREVQWITEDVGRIFPQEWDRFANTVPDRLRHLRLVDAYATMLADPDPIVHDKAAREWCTWEDAHVSLSPGHTPNPRYPGPRIPPALCSAGHTLLAARGVPRGGPTGSRCRQTERYSRSANSRTLRQSVRHW